MALTGETFWPWVGNPGGPGHAEKSFRLFFDHKDTKTGIHYIFAGHGCNGSIWKGAYNPNVPGEIEWDTIPDHPWVDGKSGRVLGLAEADGVLYAAIRPDEKDLSSQGLFRRTDGNSPKWEKVYQWPIPPAYDGSLIALRGLTGIRAPDGSHDILLANNQSANTVIRIDPANGFRDSIEMNVRAYFEDLWGELRFPRPGGAIQGCYNFMTRFTHPTSGKKMNILNFQVFPSKPEHPLAHASQFFFRHENGMYEYGAVLDPTKPVPSGMLLDVARTVAVSPFSQDNGRVIYFGGPDECCLPNR